MASTGTKKSRIRDYWQAWRGLLTLGIVLATAPLAAQGLSTLDQTVEIDLDALRDAAAIGDGYSVQLSGETITLRLQEANVLSPFLATQFARASLYKGTIVEWPGSQVRLRETPQGLEGYIQSQAQYFRLEPEARTPRSSDHLWYVPAEPSTPMPCGCSATPSALPPAGAAGGGGGGPSGGGGSVGPMLELELGVQLDVEFYQLHGADSENRVQTIINELNGIFEPELGIHVVVDDLQLWTAEPDPYSGATASQLIGELTWQSLTSGLGTDLIVLLSGKQFSNPAGISHLGTLCNPGNNVSVARDIGSLTYRLVAHEFGHNLGSVHDPVGITPQYIMSTIGTGPTVSLFSPASHQQIENVLQYISCLEPIGDSPFIRGDCDGSMSINIGDAMSMLSLVFQSTASTTCVPACDTDDDDLITIGDPLILLQIVFNDATPPGPPFPACGMDPSASPCTAGSCP